jgi:hypothetical protein
VIVTVGLIVVFTAAAAYFLVEVARGRPFLGRARGSTSLARALLSGGLALGAFGGAINDHAAPSIVVSVLGFLLLVAGVGVLVWQGWSESARTARDARAESPVGR